MDGTITFRSVEALAAFLKAFTGATATFTVHEDGSEFVLTFTKGH